MKKPSYLPAGCRETAPYLLLVLAVFAAYANVYHAAFLLDDHPLITDNKFLRDWKHIPDILTNMNYAGAGLEGGNYRPVTTLLHLVLFQMFGLSKPAFHSLNVVLQAINAMLVYRLGRKLGFTAGAVFSATLLWCVHPLSTLVVTMVSSIPELLWTTFILSGLLALLPDFTPRRICLALLFFLLALGSKETAIVFPALAVACLFVTSKDRLNPAIYIKTWPFWLISAVDALIWMHSIKTFMFNPQDLAVDPNLYALNPVNRILTFLATMPAYFSLIIWPTGLHFPRSFPVFSSIFSWQVLAGAVMVAGAAAQIILGKGKRGLPLSFGFFWFAAALSPLSGILLSIDAIFCEGWMYVPTIGLALGVAQTLAVRINSLKSRQVQIITATIIATAALAFGVKTNLQNEVYDTPGAFFENSLRCGDDLPDTHNNLGVYYLSVNEFDKAIEQLKLVVVRPGIRPPPMMAGLYVNLAIAYLRIPTDENGLSTLQGLSGSLPHTHQIPEAVDALNKALEIQPDLDWAHRFLNVIHDYQQKQKNGEIQ